jgi:hypothetical protein
MERWSARHYGGHCRRNMSCSRFIFSHKTSHLQRGQGECWQCSWAIHSLLSISVLSPVKWRGGGDRGRTPKQTYICVVSRIFQPSSYLVYENSTRSKVGWMSGRTWAQCLCGTQCRFGFKSCDQCPWLQGVVCRCVTNTDSACYRYLSRRDVKVCTCIHSILNAGNE